MAACILFVRYRRHSRFLGNRYLRSLAFCQQVLVSGMETTAKTIFVVVFLSSLWALGELVWVIIQRQF